MLVRQRKLRQPVPSRRRIGRTGRRARTGCRQRSSAAAITATAIPTTTPSGGATSTPVAARFQTSTTIPQNAPAPTANVPTAANHRRYGCLSRSRVESRNPAPAQRATIAHHTPSMLGKRLSVTSGTTARTKSDAMARTANTTWPALRPRSLWNRSILDAIAGPHQKNAIASAPSAAQMGQASAFQPSALECTRASVGNITAPSPSFTMAHVCGPGSTIGSSGSSVS